MINCYAARMDKDDQACKHELLRIVKTIVVRERTTTALTTLEDGLHVLY